MSLRLRHFARDTGYNFVRQIWTLLLALVTSIILARVLGVEDRGVYALTFLLPVLTAMLANSGVQNAVIFMVARADFDLGAIVTGTLALSTGVSLIGGVLSALFVTLFHDLLFAGVSLELLFLGLLIFPVTVYKDNLASVFRGREDFVSYNQIELIPQTVILLFTLVFVWWLRLGVTGALLAIILGRLLAFGMALYLLWRLLLKQSQPAFRLNRAYIQQTLNYGVRAHMGHVVHLFNYRADILMLTLLTGQTAAVGLYDVAVTLAERLWTVSQSVSMVLLPRAASPESDEATRRHLTPLITRHVLWGSMAMAIVVFLFAPWVIRLLYGEEFRESALALRILLIGIVMLAAGRIVASDLAGRGLPEINARLGVVASASNLILNAILIPRMGFSGAAVASAVSYTLLTLLIANAYHRIVRVPWLQLWWITAADLALWRSGWQRLRARVQRSS